MDVSISNVAPAAVSSLLNKIKVQPGSIWPVAQASSQPPCTALNTRARCLPLHTTPPCWPAAVLTWLPASLLMQFGHVSAEEGYSVRWQPDSSFVSPCRAHDSPPPRYACACSISECQARRYDRQGCQQLQLRLY
jgi:hypothetical protein